MKRKLGILAECVIGEDVCLTLERIANAGFETIFSNAVNIKAVEKVKNKADELNLETEFLHVPFANINSMWIPGESYKTIYNGMTETIDSAAACGINTIIAHVSSGWRPPEICDLGLKRYDDLVEYAEKKRVTVAFENLRKVGNISYFADRYESCDYVRFCYDCGHEHCYTETVCFPDIFRDKMICTHIHDNYGRNREVTREPDLHLMPFDGNVDYSKMMRKLDEYGYTGSLMLEISTAPYPDKSPEEFISQAYACIKKISAM